MKIHIVKQGDTLYELAKKYHIELDKLIAANPQIANPDQIDTGMKVKIPTAPKPMEPPSGSYQFKHVVKQGDTLWKLSKAWDVPLADLIAANPQLKNPNVLLTGEIVYIPKKGGQMPPSVPAVPGHTAAISEQMPAMTEETAPMQEHMMMSPDHMTAMHEQMSAMQAVPQEPPHALAGFPAAPHIDGLAEPQLYGETPYMPHEEQWSAMGAPGMHAGSGVMEPHFQFEHLQMQEQVLPEPFGGVQGWEPPAVHPFAQENIPATEALAHAQQLPMYANYPEFPQLPNEPFEQHLQAYGGFPYHTGYPAAPVIPAYDYPMAAYPYPYSHTGDCGCYGPKLDMPGAYGYSPLPYAAPLGMPYTSPVPYPGLTGAESFAELPHYPQPGYSHPYPLGHAATPWGAKLDETAKETDIDITLSDGKRAGAAKASASSTDKKAKPPRSQLQSYINSLRHEEPEKKPRRQNVPWINV